MFNDLLHDAIRNYKPLLTQVALEKGARAKQYDIDYATGMGYLKIIKLFINRNIYPTRYGATAAYFLNNIEILNFLAEYNIYPYSTMNNINIERKIDEGGRSYVDINIIYEPGT